MFPSFRRFATKRIFSFCFCLVLLAAKPGYSQMRQVYLDVAGANEIYKISFYNPSSGYVAFRDWIGYTTDTGRTFIKKYITASNVNFGSYSVNLTFGFIINGVKAFDQNKVIVYGNYGLVPAILYSDNGANTFTLVFHSLYNPNQFNEGIKDMVFPEGEMIGFAVDADRVIKTTNGGLSWSFSTAYAGAMLSNIEAASNSIVIAFNRNRNENKLVRTSNGGSSWINVTTPPGAISYVYFRSGGVGWINMVDGNSNGSVYKTLNSGLTWTIQNNPQATSFVTNKMKFLDDNTAIGLSFQNTVYKSTDGGNRWEPFARDNNYSYLGFTHNDLYFFDGSQFWAGGGHGFLELTTNGGGQTLPKAYFRIDTTGVVPGGNVNLVNFSRPGLQYKWYVNGVHVSNNYSASYTHVFNRDRDTVKLVVTDGQFSDSLQKIQIFSVPPIPTANSFTPTTGSTGTMVIIYGVDFTGVTGVSFGGVPASSFSIISPTQIRAIVAGGASGSIGLTNVFGTFLYSGFTYIGPSSAPPPIVTSFAPQSGLVGTTVTVNGFNFNPVTSNNIVHFGATRANVSSASATQLTCTVPVGASFLPISVINTENGLTGYSETPFSPVFSDSSSFTYRSFLYTMSFYYGQQRLPMHIAGSDIDGDGKTDLISSIYLPDSIEIHRNTSTNGNFSFAPKVTFPTNLYGGSGKFTVKDLDGDGKPDIICSGNQAFVRAYRNLSTLGNIAFAPELLVLAADGTQHIAVDDLDNDGKPDLAVANFNNGSVSVIRNTSSPGYLSFGLNNNYAVGGYALSVAVGDLDGDQKKDIVTIYRIGNSGTGFSYFMNQSTVGNISFSARTDITVTGATGESPEIFITDFDGDGKRDLAVLNQTGYFIYRNVSINGVISFDPPVLFPASSFNGGGAIANLSGDRRQDFLAGGSSSFKLLRNVSSPGTISASPFVGISTSAEPTFNDPRITATADFNGDGKPDIITSSFTGRVISIYRNNVGVQVGVPLCSGGDGLIDADLVGTTYQWQQYVGSGFVNISNSANITGTQTWQLSLWSIPYSWNGYRFRCIIDGEASSTFVLQITNVPAPIVNISASTNSVCFGTPITFTATAQNAGASPIYQWQVNGVTVGSNLPTYTTSALNNNDQVRLIVINALSCANYPRDTSNVISMFITGGPSSVSISASQSAICNGTPVTFTATATNGGNPSYQWQVNGVNVGTNSNTFTSSTLTQNAQVRVQMTPNGTCLSSTPVSSNTIAINVTSSVTPSVVINSNAQSICSGQTVLFTAIPTNGGSSPSYQWKVNGVNTGSNSNTFSSSILSNTDEVSVILTSSASCITTTTANSNSIIVSVNSAVTPSVSVAPSATLICSGSPVIFTATATNGGSSPFFQWQVNGVNTGGNTSSFTTNGLTDGAQVKVILTSNANCASPVNATSNIITMAVSPLITPSVSISTSANTICSGTNVLFTAVPTGGGTNPAYQWQVDGTNVGGNASTYSSNSLTNGAQVKVIMTSNANCTSSANATSNIIPMTVNAGVMPLVTIAASATTICTGTNVTFTATPTHGGNSPVYQWKKNGVNTGANSSVYSNNSLVNGDIISVLMTSNAQCVSTPTATGNSITMTVNNNVVPAITISGETTIVAGQTSLLTATISNGGSAPVYEWQDSTVSHTWQAIAGAVNSQISYVPAATGDKIRGKLTSNAVCASPAVVTSNPLTFTLTTVTSTNPIPGTQYGIRLYPNPTSSSFIIDTLRLADRWQSFYITSLDGKQKILSGNMANKTKLIVNVSALPGGFYLLILRKVSGKEAYFKFIKQ